MADSPLTYALLGAAAFSAGAVNAVAGGGTLLTFPTLLAIINPIAANATSTIALLPGSIASVWAYRAELGHTRVMLSRLWLPSLLGGVVGALAVTRFPERVFASLIPWLLLLASTLLLLQRPVARWLGAHPHEAPKASTITVIVLFQFLVGIYGGYFGAGIGILMLSTLGFMGINDIHQMNGLKTMLAVIINAVTVVIFLAEGVVVWKYAGIMIAAAIAGGYIGARVARRMPAVAVRYFVVAIGFAVAGYSFYKRLSN
ncbi:MAG: sulfite exporter TauE/SafE family protein [Acidobacteriia bacterium]|nr:sulfite exporter TauE/SafE family protein [Terriglobia bacterium]